MKCAQFGHASWMNGNCSVQLLHCIHTHIKHKWYMTCTSWQHLRNHLPHNCIKNSKQSTVKEAIFWQVQDSTKCLVVPCLENIFGLKEATPDECCSALPSTVQRNFRTPFMYTTVKDTERMSHRVPCMYYMLQSQVSISSQCTTVMGWDTKICGTCHTVPSRPMAHRNSRWPSHPLQDRQWTLSDRILCCSASQCR